MPIPHSINLRAAAGQQINTLFDPYVAGDINQTQVKVAKFGPTFDWHAHPQEDEAFFVLQGRIVIDFRDGSVELGEGDFLVVPRAIEHRPRSLTSEPIVMLIEPASTINTGEQTTSNTVTDLKRLR